MIVVADTSPINYLVLIEQVEVLRHLYDRVLLPPSVWKELHHPATPDEVRFWIGTPPSWLEYHTLSIEPDQALDFLGRGEREAITLAEELKADRLIVDEAPARLEAIRRNIAVIGTLGVLRDAARAGLLNFPAAIAKLRSTSFYASPDLIQLLLDEDATRTNQR
jgi:predicted nucleic acid-binding protein